MFPRSFPALVFITGTLFVAGCDEEPEPPSQQSVEEAWKRTDQAVQQSVAARADVKHMARLRDIDQLRNQADITELTTQITALRGLSIGLALVLLAALIWLAVEVRRRRILSAIIPLARPVGNDRFPTDSPDAEAQPLIS